MSILSTGIPQLDDVLESRLLPGNLIGIIGYSGGGKTILATQFLRGALNASPVVPTLFVSMEAPPIDLLDRIISAEFSIPYDKLARKSEEVPRFRGLPFPNPAIYGEAIFHSACGLIKRVEEHVQYLMLDPKTDGPDGPLTMLHSKLDDFLGKLGSGPGLVIFDYIANDFYGLSTYKSREFMNEVMSILRNRTINDNLLGIAFAQADPEHEGKRCLKKDDISTCKTLFNDVDAFIGIGREIGDDNITGPDDVKSAYRTKQNFHVIGVSPKPKNVRVLTRFEYQRFEGRIEKEKPVGYLPFTRSRYKELCALSTPHGLNVYLFLALWARYLPGDPDIGKCWPSLIGITKFTGLTLKQVRTAIKALVEKNLITKQHRPTTDKYKVEGWTLHHSAATIPKGEDSYIRIYRKLLEEDQKRIFSNPKMLRLWMYLLMNARFFNDRKNWDLSRGTLSFDLPMIEHDTGIKEDECVTLLEELEADESIETREGINIPKVIHITNWDFYQEGD